MTGGGVGDSVAGSGGQNSRGGAVRGATTSKVSDNGSESSERSWESV